MAEQQANPHYPDYAERRATILNRWTALNPGKPGNAERALRQLQAEFPYEALDVRRLQDWSRRYWRNGVAGLIDSHRPIGGTR